MNYSWFCIYRLHPSLKRFALPPAAWEEKTAPGKESWWGRFMKAVKPTTTTPTATTKDGRLTVLTAPCGGKKPCQVKRKRTAKTRSLKRTRFDE